MATAKLTLSTSRSKAECRPVRRAIFWGSRTNGVTGQSIISDHVLEGLGDISWIDLRYSIGGLRSFFSVIARTFSAYYATSFGRTDFIYVVCSRSTFGFLRDFPILMLSLFGKKTIIHVHGSDILDLLKRRFIGVLARSLYQRCAIIIPSAHLDRALRQLGCTSVHVVENFATDLDHSVDAAPLPAHTPAILWNSNIMASKGIMELVKGAELARRRGADLHLTIIGKMIPDRDATQDQLERFIASLANKPWITVLGPVPHRRAIELLRQADIVALPSRYASECQPLAIIQAMCLAKSVIVADTPALKATIGTYPAIVTTPDPSSLADAIEVCLAQANALQISQTQAAPEAIERFSIKKFDKSMSVLFS